MLITKYVLLYINGEFCEDISYSDCLMVCKQAQGDEKSRYKKNLARCKNFDKDTSNNNKIAFIHKTLDNYSEDDYNDGSG